ncbi:MAG: hypothetical protein KDB14_11025 [Planctomycetales bacterium]|nr:hypothetical protein [Planctomycetales bacterium]
MTAGFHGAALLLGLGKPDDPSVRRALKMALMLTDLDGPGIPAENTRLLFEPKVRDLQAQVDELAKLPSTPFETLCVYAAGELARVGSETHLRPCNATAADLGISLSSLAEAVSHLPTQSVAVILDPCPGTAHPTQMLPQFSEELFNLLRASHDRVALLTGTAYDCNQALNEELLEWLTGRKSSQADTVTFDSLEQWLSGKPGHTYNWRREGNDIRVGLRFPWLNWHQRTTIPGHAVSSLHELVEQNAQLLVERTRTSGLSAKTLGGLSHSLYANIWREAQLQTRPGPAERAAKLSRDREIISAALLANKLNCTATADALGVSRSTLYSKLRRLNISTASLRRQLEGESSG